ncbi:MAG: U32 family peptidase [Lachnospiraceae bacterium]|jgi:putative protease|nr:U32 family peptidase [Lachnospiraceae bacterium]MCH4070115.1 U32 family peptidase [Lachnospiraceae bacterium]MCH4108533.1 U32 family peptidase [Lachnospiraceae bacterium]MCI1302652.1 U32 family peptidase [Lachnospiraceae bacterium]MCI1331836.1 U32 family peptidase [Lachnospiraceae bacterium]
MRRKVELLAPAGSLDVLKTAVIYGADAVYIGGEAFGLRANAKNFTKEQMREGIAFAHERGAKVYVTANILAHNADLEPARVYFRELEELRPDAALISDPGLFLIAKEEMPDVPIHISTQANNTNYGTYNFWFDLGATRVVAARELSLAEIREIREHIPADREIEAFVHGAMCISYSGRCLLSNFLTGRDANRGECTHPCRWKYRVQEETRPGQYMDVDETDRGTFIFNSKDLCMIEHIPEMMDAGIDSFKIEGRMKTALYVATVVRTYRMAIDAAVRDPQEYRRQLPFYHEEIRKCTYRPYTTGFMFGKPTSETQVYEDVPYLHNYVYIGTVQGTDDAGRVMFPQKNKFTVGETLELMKPDGRNLAAHVKGIWDDDGCAMESAPHPKQMLHVQLDVSAQPWDILRRKSTEDLEEKEKEV